LASPTDVGTELLVRDRRPPAKYAYIMPEAQQRRVLAEAPRLRVGETVEEVVAKLGPPSSDDMQYPSIKSNKTYRHMKYYFARRNFNSVNLNDPSIELFFDVNGRLDSMPSDVDGIPSLNWPYGD
jgi:hypothetical protein